MPSAKSDVIVVGNSVIGLSIAFELARRGTGRVIVLGPATRSGAGSLAAGAMLNCFGEVTKYTMTHQASRAKLDVCRHALDAWPKWRAAVLEEVEGGPDSPEPPIREGTHVILNSRSGLLDSENFLAMLDALDKHSEPYEEIDPRTVPGLDPLPDARPLRAVYLPNEGSIDARAFLHKLELAVRVLGVEVIEAEARSLVILDGEVQGIELSSGDVVEASRVVVAAGVYSQELLSPLEFGRIPPLMCGAGISLESRRVKAPAFESVIRTPNRSGSCGLHLVPLGNGLEYVGATNIVFRRPAVEANMGMSQFLLECAREQLDQKLFYSRIRRWFVGNRPVSIDGYPLIGPTSVRGLVLATGTYRDGFHCSPTVAQFVADLVREEDSGTGHLFDLFVPERPPIASMSVDESISEFAYHGVCSAFEGGLRLPPWNDSSALEQHYRRAAEHFYSSLGDPIGLLPEMLKFIAFNYRDEGDIEFLVDYFAAARAQYAHVD